MADRTLTSRQATNSCDPGFGVTGSRGTGSSRGLDGSRSLMAFGLASAAAIALYLTEGGRNVRKSLAGDIAAIRERDPAANSLAEILCCYSGFHALVFHRLAHALWLREVPLLPRLVSQISRFLTGIEIHPGAVIANGLFIDHGSGVVIGETSEIGNNVTIYQGVTLGGTGKESGKRHPTIEDNVVVGAGAKVLGAITIGKNAKIGAGSVVVQNVPADTTVVGNPGRPVMTDGTRVGIPDIDYRHLPDPVAEAIQCVVRRVVELENELEEYCPPKQRRMERSRANLDEQVANLTGFNQGLGI